MPCSPNKTRKKYEYNFVSVNKKYLQVFTEEEKIRDVKICHSVTEGTSTDRCKMKYVDIWGDVYLGDGYGLYNQHSKSIIYIIHNISFSRSVEQAIFKYYFSYFYSQPF